MACSNPVSSETPSSKRKRCHSPLLNPQEEREEEEEANANQPKKSKPSRKVWANLDVILSLNSKDISRRRKIELAFDFVTLEAGSGDAGPEPVRFSRLVSFLSEWIQSLLISSADSEESSDLSDACLDYRCWVILKFCLGQSSVGVAPNLLRAVTRVARFAVEGFDGDGLSDREESGRFFQQVLECLSLVFLSNARAFYNTRVELWVSCAAEVVGVVRRVSANDDRGSSDAEALSSFSVLVLGHFAIFLRFHPNPRNIFRVFVDRLLEPMLELLVLLHVRANGWKSGQVGDLVRVVEDVLSNGLFHPAHISGFMTSKSLSAKNEARELKGINESYHRHFFHTLEKIIAEKKAVLLSGFGYLLRLFISRTKARKGAPLVSKGERTAGKSGEVSEEAQETSKPLFEVFAQFMEPLLLECRRCAKMDFSNQGEKLEISLVEAHCMFKSVNEILLSFIQEKIYVRTEDTSEETHYNFLKDVYDTIISMSGKIYLLWLSVLHMDDARVKKVLALLAREVFVAVGHFLDIEYKVVTDDLVKLWLMMFSYLAVCMPLGDTEPCSLLMSGILNIGCQVIKIYSELRQVNSPIFALCKAMRLFRADGDAAAADYSIFVASSPISTQICLKSLAALLCSQEFRLAISNAIKLIPERQASGCVEQLTIDLVDSLEWLGHNSLKDDCLGLDESKTVNNSTLDIHLRAEILGGVLSELYIIVLDSLTVTATNSIFIGNSVKNLMTSIRPSLSDLVQDQTDSVNEFFFSLIGTNLSNHEIREFESGLQRALSLRWIFVLFFRTYVSCRSLYRQSISLMPPDSSKKASEAMGNLFTVCCGREWTERTRCLDEGYFSWIVKPSISLLAIIQQMSEDFLSSSSTGYAPLVYTLHVMALQRLNDLNRQIKALVFLKKWDARVVQMENSDRQKAGRLLKQLIESSRKEAAGLTYFMTRYLPVPTSDRKYTCNQYGDGGPIKTPCIYEDAWDLGVFSLNENSLPIAIWWLLCRNIDIWCVHATRKDLKGFLSCLLYYSLPRGSTSGDMEQQSSSGPFCQKVTLHHTSLELISDTVFYEQRVLFRHFTSRFCHILKKSLSSITIHACASDVDLDSLPDWSEILDVSKMQPVVDMEDGQVLNNHSYPTGSDLGHVTGCCAINNKEQLFLPLDLELRTCESLLHLLSKMPGVHVNAKSFKLYATYILHLERLMVSNLLSCRAVSFVSSPFELFRLFISCRRAMKYLVMASVDSNIESSGSLIFSSVFNSSYSFLWLLKSVYETVGMLQTFFEEKYSRPVEHMIFSLIDHTSHIFYTISKGLMSSALPFLINYEKLFRELPVHDDSKKDASDEADEHADTSECNEAWKCLQLLAEMLKGQTRKLLVNLENSTVKLEASFNILSWNKLSSTVSCFQGFLWGIVSGLDSIYEDCSTRNLHSSRLKLWCVSELSNYVAVFESFVNLCVNILLVDNSQGMDTRHSLHNLPELDCRNGVLTLDMLIQNATKCCSEVEQSTKDQYETHKPGGSGACSASCIDDDDSKRPSDHEHTRSSKFKKRKSSTIYGNAFNAIHKLDLSNLQNLKGYLLKGLLKGDNPRIAFALRQLFSASAAILKFKCMLSLPGNLGMQTTSSHVSNSMDILVGTSHFLLQEIADMQGKPDSFTFVWIDGVLRYLEVVGNYFSLTDSNLSTNVYAQLIDSHLRAIGKCIALQGKAATLSSHETGSNTKMLQSLKESEGCGLQSLDHGQCSINAFNARLRMSLRKFIGRSVKLHLKEAVQAIERALVGVHQVFNVIYETKTGNVDGGNISSIVAAGIDSLDLVLEHVSRHKDLVEEKIPSFVGSLFNILSHLQSPRIFYVEQPPHNKSEVNPDAGAVSLMCVEVLTAVAGRHSLEMDPCHASQCLHVPVTLFKNFHQLRASHIEYRPSVSSSNQEVQSSTDMYHYVIDRQFCIDIYASCCRLLWTMLKHRIRMVERCVAILEDSVTTLLGCLETVDAKLVCEDYFVWELPESIKCASFLRRVYEEIRQQKDVLAGYSFYFLSTYVCIFSGYGHSGKGIKREIDEALRPGVYSLIDICTETDRDRLHAILSAGPCRSTLATLVHDWRLNFQFEGKI